MGSDGTRNQDWLYWRVVAVINPTDNRHNAKAHRLTDRR
jgi:hypothetical protein